MVDVVDKFKAFALDGRENKLQSKLNLSTASQHTQG